MTLDGTPPEKCEIRSIDGIWKHQAVNLESLIKGAFTADGTKPDPLWNFDHLRALVGQKQKLVLGQVQPATDQIEIDGALALIDFFSDPENVETVLKYYALDGYQFQWNSTAPVRPEAFTWIDDHPMPKVIAAQYGAICNQVKTETGRVLTLASGYRSPAYQLYLLCAGSYSRQRQGIEPNLGNEFKKIAPPFCSKHSSVDNPALDVADFIPNDSHVLEGGDTCERIREHTVWQVFARLAEQYGYKENYPVGTINDKQGEPWEWQKQRTEIDALLDAMGNRL